MLSIEHFGRIGIDQYHLMLQREKGHELENETYIFIFERTQHSIRQLINHLFQQNFLQTEVAQVSQFLKPLLEVLPTGLPENETNLEVNRCLDM